MTHLLVEELHPIMTEHRCREPQLHKSQISRLRGGYRFQINKLGLLLQGSSSLVPASFFPLPALFLADFEVGVVPLGMQSLKPTLSLHLTHNLLTLESELNPKNKKKIHIRRYISAGHICHRRRSRSRSGIRCFKCSQS